MEASRKIVYLDTNHLSRLGRTPDGRDESQFVHALSRADARVSLSIIHLIELSHPDFRSGETVAALLDALPIVWARPLDEIWENEVHAAYAAYFHTTISFEPFGSSVNYAIGGRHVDATPSQAIESFRGSDLREEIERTTVAGLMFDAMKTDATLVTDPLKLLKRMIASRRPRKTATGIVIDPSCDPVDVLKAVGGLSGFPSYFLLHRIATGRLRDKSFRAKQSDVYDLMHAAYVPYASYTALDRSYAARVRRARPDLAVKVTHELPDVSAWLTV